MADNSQTKYDAKTMPALARQWRSEGASMAQIAERFGVDESSLRRWRVRYAELSAALQEGSAEAANARVEAALLKRAEGFSYEEVTKVTIGKEPVRKKVVTKYVPPDINAQKFWLINRRKERWKTSPPQEDEHFGEQLEAFTSTLVGKAKTTVEEESDEASPQTD